VKRDIVLKVLSYSGDMLPAAPPTTQADLERRTSPRGCGTRQALGHPRSATHPRAAARRGRVRSTACLAVEMEPSASPQLRIPGATSGSGSSEGGRAGRSLRPPRRPRGRTARTAIARRHLPWHSRAGTSRAAEALRMAANPGASAPRARSGLSSACREADSERVTRSDHGDGPFARLVDDSIKRFSREGRAGCPHNPSACSASPPRAERSIFALFGPPVARWPTSSTTSGDALTACRSASQFLSLRSERADAGPVFLFVGVPPAAIFVSACSRGGKRSPAHRPGPALPSLDFSPPRAPSGTSQLHRPRNVRLRAGAPLDIPR